MTLLSLYAGWFCLNPVRHLVAMGVASLVAAFAGSAVLP